jgi:hypothetical protein
MTPEHVEAAKVRLDEHADDKMKHEEFVRHAPTDLKSALAALDRVRKVVTGHPDNSIVLVKAIHDALDG